MSLPSSQGPESQFPWVGKEPESMPRHLEIWGGKHDGKRFEVPEGVMERIKVFGEIRRLLDEDSLGKVKKLKTK